MRKRKENNNEMVSKEPKICVGRIGNKDAEAASIAIKENNDTFNNLFGSGAVINPYCGITKIPTVYDTIYDMQDFMSEASENIMNDPKVSKMTYIEQRRSNFFEIFGNRVRYLAMNIIGNVTTLLRFEGMYIANPEDFTQGMLCVIVPYFDSMVDDLQITKAENLTSLNVIAYFQNEVVPVMLSGIFNCIYKNSILDTGIVTRVYYGNSSPEYNDLKYNDSMESIDDIMGSIKDMLCFTYFQLRSELLMYYHNNTLLEYMPAAIQQQKGSVQEFDRSKEKPYYDCKSMKDMGDTSNSESNPFNFVTITEF